jgi:hypothetical protein
MKANNTLHTDQHVFLSLSDGSSLSMWSKNVPTAIFCPEGENRIFCLQNLTASYPKRQQYYSFVQGLFFNAELSTTERGATIGHNAGIDVRSSARSPVLSRDKYCRAGGVIASDAAVNGVYIL